jgi:hypothetical protein
MNASTALCCSLDKEEISFTSLSCGEVCGTGFFLLFSISPF